MKCELIWATVIVLIIMILVINGSPRRTPNRTQERVDNPPLGYIPPYWQKQLNRIQERAYGSGIPERFDTPNAYCPYRALIGKWRSSPTSQITQIVREYEFSTMPDGKTLLLRMRHVMLNDDNTTYDRGECIMKDFTCVQGLAGDLTITAKCVSDLLPGTLVNAPPRTFHVRVSSRGMRLVDALTGTEFVKA